MSVLQILQDSNMCKNQRFFIGYYANCTKKQIVYNKVHRKQKHKNRKNKNEEIHCGHSVFEYLREENK